MSAERRLLESYKEWRRLAETEGEAIRVHNWPMVADCQKALQLLQPIISRHTQEVLEQNGLERSQSLAAQEHYGELLAELIQIEARNKALLHSAWQAAQIQAGQLKQAAQMLRRVRRFYAPSSPGAWTSVS